MRHSASRLTPGGSSLRLDEPLLFLLGQLALIGPSLGVALILGLVLRWRDPEGHHDDRRLLLGAFTVPPLAVATLSAVVARANLNWAAPTFVAGCLLAVAWALHMGRRGPLARAVALNAALGLALYIALVAAPVIWWRGEPVGVAAHFQGWGELGRRIAVRAAELGDAHVLTDLRELLPVAGYYGRVPASRLVEWNPSAVPHSQFQVRSRLDAGDPGPWLYVSYRPRPSGVLKRFAHADLRRRGDRRAGPRAQPHALAVRAARLPRLHECRWPRRARHPGTELTRMARALQTICSRRRSRRSMERNSRRVRGPYVTSRRPAWAPPCSSCASASWSPLIDPRGWRSGFTL